MTTIERRASALEIRAQGRKLQGFAATYSGEAKIGRTIETIAPGAFAETLSRGRDVLALVDHDPGRLLARTRSGTLRLKEERQGLAFELDLPDTQLGRDVLALAARGDLGGMSFGFHALDERFDGNRRELRKVELVEISVVQAFPAYSDTSINLRSGAQLPPRLACAARTLRIAELSR